MTCEKRHLLEAASLIGESAREDGAWKVRLISEGQGSSGFYSRELLENHYEVFNDILSFKNHPTGWDGPETRDFTQIVGEIVGETWVEDDERGMAAITGWYLPDPEHKEKIERYKNKLGVSIYAMGEGEFDENTGNFRVTSFEEDPYNSLDVVIAAGARGKFLESMRKHYERQTKTPAASAVETDKEGLSEMAEKDILDAINGLKAVVDALAESKQEKAKVEVEASVIGEAVKSGVSAFAERNKAIAEADILDSQKAALIVLATEGKDITADLASAVAIAKEAKEAFGAQGDKPAPETGRLGEAIAPKSAVELGKVFG